MMPPQPVDFAGDLQKRIIMMHPRITVMHMAPLATLS
jgi:hypothetical protein